MKRCDYCNKIIIKSRHQYICNKCGRKRDKQADDHAYYMMIEHPDSETRQRFFDNY